MEKTAIAEEVMKTIGEFLGGVSDARIKRYAATLVPVKKGEQPLGSLHSEDTKRLFVLSHQLDKLEDQATARAALAETDEEKEADIQISARYAMYCKLTRGLAWVQLHEDIGGCFWNDNVGLRQDWLAVRMLNDNPIDALKSRLEQLMGESGIVGRIDIRREED